MDTRKALEALTAGYEHALASGDAEAASAFFTEDGMFLLQGRPVVQERAELTALHPGWIDAQQAGRHTILTCEEDGDLAYATGSFTGRLQNDQGETVEFAGKYMDLFRRQPGDPWKVQASCAFSE